MTLNDFESQVESKIVERGFDYFTEDLIEEIAQFDKGEFGATILGSEEYSIYVKLKGAEVVEWACDCPYDWGNICKHVVATLYYLRESELYKEKPDPHTNLRALLNKISDAKLRAFTLNALKRNKKFREIFLEEFGE